MFTKMGNSIQERKKVTGIIVAQAQALEGRSNILHPNFEPLTDDAFRNVNIPWPSQGMGDGDYMYAFQQVVMPIAQEFNPDLVISMKFPTPHCRESGTKHL